MFHIISFFCELIVYFFIDVIVDCIGIYYFRQRRSRRRRFRMALFPSFFRKGNPFVHGKINSFTDFVHYLGCRLSCFGVFFLDCLMVSACAVSTSLNFMDSHATSQNAEQMFWHWLGVTSSLPYQLTHRDRHSLGSALWMS